MAKFPPIIRDVPMLLHGADYNPEQWICEKETIWKKDMLLAKEAGVNVLSIGIFSWAMLEPVEDEYHFEWLDEVMDMLAANGIKAILATPSGARPAWLAEKYPEVLRVDSNMNRHMFGARHNHCLSSPVYRKKVQKINTLLAERYKNHPALGMWHISNEYGGKCYCPLCQERFRDWLKVRYGTIDALNDAWWNTFWSHRYSSFEQIESPSPLGESSNQGLDLAWKRFTTDQFCDFYQCEIEPLKRITPDIPCTTNMVEIHEAIGINYFRLGRLLDVASWDNYPNWTNDERDARVAIDASFKHSLMRAVGGNKPYLMMESSPSAVNWQTVNRLRTPGILMLQSLEAIAHGSDSVQYFQFRKGRGAFEKYHGAIIGHDNSNQTRIFKEVSSVGATLQALKAVQGSSIENKIAVVFDWENDWALENAAFGHFQHKGYEETVIDWYAGFAWAGYGVDIIDETFSLDGYQIVCAPMLYMLRPDFSEKIDAFVQAGGTFIATYCSGWVDHEDLCYMGGYPGPLRKVLGIWDEETDALDETQHNQFTWRGKTYQTKDWGAVIHTETAIPLSRYEKMFYADAPVLTENCYGKGKAYYVAARTDEDFLVDFAKYVGQEAQLPPILPNLPHGVFCTERFGNDERYLFVMNTLPVAKNVSLPILYDIQTRKLIQGETVLAPYGVLTLTDRQSVSRDR